jgi:hypothetical protein
MSSRPTKDVSDVFDLLDRWRHFPAYQLERRADIFFALYLPGIVEHALGVAVDPWVIPEFPIRKEYSRRSTKVDYFLLSEDRSSALFVPSRLGCQSGSPRKALSMTTPRMTRASTRSSSVSQSSASRTMHSKLPG